MQVGLHDIYDDAVYRLEDSANDAAIDDRIVRPVVGWMVFGRSQDNSWTAGRRNYNSNNAGWRSQATSRGLFKMFSLAPQRRRVTSSI